MGTIVIIKNKYLAVQTIIEHLKNHYKLYVVENAVDAQKITEKYQIDFVMIIGKDPLDEKTGMYISYMHQEIAHTFPLLYSLKEKSPKLNQTLNHNGLWYFLTYPFDLDKLLPILAEAMSISTALNNRHIFVPSGRKHIKLYVRDITKIKREGNRDILIYSQNPLTKEERPVIKIRFSSALSNFMSNFNVSDIFVQINQSWLVNHAEIHSIQPTQRIVTLKDGSTLSLGRAFAKNVINDVIYQSAKH